MILGADNGVAKSDGGDVRGTWLQLVKKYNMIFPIFIERQMRPQYIYSVARGLMCAQISNPPVAS